MTAKIRIWTATALLLTCAACGNNNGNAVAEPSAAECERAAATALLACIDGASAADVACYDRDGAICVDGDSSLSAALDAAGQAVLAGCSDAAVRQADYGPEMTVGAVARRIQASCQAEASSLAVRTYGGPQGAAWANAAGNDDARACIRAAHSIATKLIDQVFTAHNACLDDGTGCASLDSDIAALEQSATTDTEAACEDISALIAVDAPTYAERAVTQAECATAMARPESDSLAIPCGPRDAIERAPRGEYARVVLNSDVWGTRCGDGSEFSFLVRLAPQGAPVENLMVAMEGGGVCLFQDDCTDRPPELFFSHDRTAPESGIMSNDPAVSPFADWTKVYLPYCNQDVFIGGGATNVFDNGFTVHRFGAINVRAALRYVRDLIWRELDESTEQGYRPDRMRVFFGGFSAGGFGTLYNYHYVLDDLQWVHTTAFPDASLALDSGGAFSVAALGAILIPESQVGWSSLNYLPPYCFATDCGVGPIGLAAAAPRLKAVPDQQVMVLTSQVDDVQASTTFFPSTPEWTNELRSQYCQLHGINGAHFYMPATPESVHVISLRPELFSDNSVDGELMVDWLWGAVTDPDGVQNRVEEGDLVDLFPGVEPFPCDIP